MFIRIRQSVCMCIHQPTLPLVLHPPTIGPCRIHAHAFLAVQKQFSGTPLLYTAFHEDAGEMPFVQNIIEEQLIASYMEGEYMPGGEKVLLRMPDDLLEALPPAPTLNKLVVLGEDSKTLGLPIALLEDQGNPVTYGNPIASPHTMPNAPKIQKQNEPCETNNEARALEQLE